MLVTANSVVLSATWIYVMPTYEGNSVSVNLASGAVTNNSTVFYGSKGWLNTAVNVIYGAQDGLSPNDVLEYTISTGPYHGANRLTLPRRLQHFRSDLVLARWVAHLHRMWDRISRVHGSQAR